MKNNRGKSINTISTSKEGYNMKIINYKRNNNIDIQFEDGTIVLNKDYGNFKKGTIKNPNKLSVYGVGYFGVGNYNSNIKAYRVWLKMLRRCYSGKDLVRNPTYKECYVDPEWHNFQNFAEWWENNYDHSIMFDWELDKDIIIKNNKVYSKTTCAIIPRELNIIFVKSNKTRGKYAIGVSLSNNNHQVNISRYGVPIYLGSFKTEIEAFQVYKNEKENYIKEIAEKWKNKINSTVYKSLLNYKVEIND